MNEPIRHAPGIYFGLDERLYHSDPALSSSGIRNLLISPLDYWVASPLNPAYVDQKTPAMEAGTAFHRRLLEPERFAELYAPMPSRADYPEAIDGHDALKAKCESLGLKKSGKIAELCERILGVEPEAQLWPVIQEQLLASLSGRILLSNAVVADIERAAAFVLAHRQLAVAFAGGFAEVSIFWIDEETGVRMKARLDYLKSDWIIDLKTFSNSFGRPIDVAVVGAMSGGVYHVQAVTYEHAVVAAKKMLITMGADAVKHMGGRTPSDEWLADFGEPTKRHRFAFVFIEQGAATNVEAREFCRFDQHASGEATANAYWNNGFAGFRKGVTRYAEFMERYGPSQPWIDDKPMKAFVDIDFPLHMLG